MPIDFRLKQAEFAAHIRDRTRPPPTDVCDKRMAIYRELFFNNINSFLSGNFPVLRKIMDENEWLTLVEDFYARHHCRTPFFSEIGEEFLGYLQNRNNLDDYPFLLELAHYEWVEMALAISKTEVIFGDQAFIADPVGQKMVLSPLAWPLIYQFPVQLISPDFLPLHPPEQPTYLIVYRDRDDNVHFIQSSALVFKLLNILEYQQPIDSLACLELLLSDIKSLDKEKLMNEGMKAIKELVARGIVIPENSA